MSTRFTVVIPTRERCDTLEWALKTCVTQDYDNLEILVSDNNSADKTEEVVRAYDDPRIRYINTGRRLSMSENFDFAISQVSSGYVTSIGDDDGLLPNALTAIDQIIEEHACRAIIWPRQPYFWPRFAQREIANTLAIDLLQREAVEVRSSKEIIRQVIEDPRSYNDLPSVYYGFIDAEILAEISKRSGSLFHSIIPDAYSGVTIACMLDTFHFSSRAFSLAGASHHSNGGSIFVGEKREDPDAPGDKFMKENTIPFHHELVHSPSLVILVMETFLQARDHLDCASWLAIDMRHVLKAAIEDEFLLVSPVLYQAVVDSVRQIAAKHGLEEYAESVIRGYKYRSLPVIARGAIRGVLSHPPLFSCDPYGVKNVYDATLASDTILQKYQSLPMKYVAQTFGYTNRARRTTLSALKARRHPA